MWYVTFRHSTGTATVKVMAWSRGSAIGETRRLYGRNIVVLSVAKG